MKFIGTFFDLCKRLIKNGGMESVTSLPTTDNFEGREVNYKGTKYIYYNGAWRRHIEYPVGKFQSMSYNDVYAENLFHIYNKSITFLIPQDKVKFEVMDNETEVVEELSLTDQKKKDCFNELYDSSIFGSLQEGKTYIIKVLYPMSSSAIVRFIALGLSGLYTNWDIRVVVQRLDAFSFDANVLEEQEIIKQDNLSTGSGSSSVCLARIPFSTIKSGQFGRKIIPTIFNMITFYITPRNVGSNPLYWNGNFYGLGIYGNLQVKNLYDWDSDGNTTFVNSVNSQETLNYDVNNIKPTQTGTVKKSSSWIWQYLVQSVNWLRDNFLPKRSHEHIYLNCDWLFIRSPVTGAIILKTPFQNTGVENNSMTYIELSVISHRAPTRVAKYIFYLYKWKPDVSDYEQKYYSVLGPQIFSNIYIGALQDNSTVIVLGDFTDTYSNFTVSIDRIVTSFNRTSDDTDKFSLYVESDESVLQYKAKFNLQSAFAKGYVVPDGTATQFLKADGSVDNNEYALKAHIHDGTNSKKIDYNNLANKPDIPEVGNGTITIKQGTNTIGSFTTNQSQNKTITLPENSDLPIASDTVLGGIKSSASISVNPTTGVAKVLNNSHNHNASNITGLSTVATTGSYADLSGKPTIYTSVTINGVNVDFSSQNNNIPSYIIYNNILYPFRFTGSAFQIYRNEVWADLVNFDNFISNDRGIITESNMEDWYRPGINEYFIDESAALNFLTLKKPLAPPEKWTNITINTGTLTSKITGLKSAVLLDNIRTNIENVFGEEPYTLYTEYDISAMLDSEFGYKLVLKLEKGTAESNSVIVECYKVW